MLRDPEQGQVVRVGTVGREGTDGRTDAPRAALTGGRVRRSAQVVWRGMRAHPRTYVLAVGLSAVFGAATVGVSQVLGQVTDRVVVPALAGDDRARASIGVTDRKSVV